MTSSSALPAVMGEGLVGLGHLVSILAALHRGARVIARLQDLGAQLVPHRLPGASPRILDEPPHAEGHPAVRPHLARDLIGGAAHATRPDLEDGHDIMKRLLDPPLRLPAPPSPPLRSPRAT